MTTIKREATETGAVLLEYVLATALLIAGLVVINATLIEATKVKGRNIAESSVQMTPCDKDDTNDVITSAISSDATFNKNDVCM
jgi:hypothetical protein